MVRFSVFVFFLGFNLFSSVGPSFELLQPPSQPNQPLTLQAQSSDSLFVLSGEEIEVSNVMVRGDTDNGLRSVLLIQDYIGDSIESSTSLLLSGIGTTESIVTDSGYVALNTNSLQTTPALTLGENSSLRFSGTSSLAWQRGEIESKKDASIIIASSASLLMDSSERREDVNRILSQGNLNIQGTWELSEDIIDKIDCKKTVPPPMNTPVTEMLSMKSIVTITETGNVQAKYSSGFNHILFE